MANKIEIPELLKGVHEMRKFVFLEALPKKYFDQGHLPGAINIPLDMSDEDIRTSVPDYDALLVTYCTGITCPNSGKLSERLTQLGYRSVTVFEEGKEGWVKSGQHLTK